MSIENRSRPEYDFPTAVTFLLAGVALGAVLAMVFSPWSNSQSDRPLRDRSLTSQRVVPVSVE